jgi:hypothetical protein
MADTKDTLPVDTTNVFCSSDGGRKIKTQTRAGAAVKKIFVGVVVEILVLILSFVLNHQKISRVPSSYL